MTKLFLGCARKIKLVLHDGKCGDKYIYLQINKLRLKIERVNYLKRALTRNLLQYIHILLFSVLRLILFPYSFAFLLSKEVSKTLKKVIWVLPVSQINIYLKCFTKCTFFLIFASTF